MTDVIECYTNEPLSVAVRRDRHIVIADHQLAKHIIVRPEELDWLVNTLTALQTARKALPQS